VSPESLNIDLTTARDGTVQLFRLSGSLDVATSPTLRAALLDAAEREDHAIVVDLSQLEFLDSTGLGALIGAHRRAAERKGSLRVVTPEGQILRLLRITGLLAVLHVHPSIDAALSNEGRLSGL
jgi:anti-sigma B factor antagonist